MTSEQWLGREKGIFFCALLLAAWAAVTAYRWLPPLEPLGPHRKTDPADLGSPGIRDLAALPPVPGRGRDFFHPWRPPNVRLTPTPVETPRPLTPQPTPTRPATRQPVGWPTGVPEQSHRPQSPTPSAATAPEPAPPLACRGVIANPPPVTVSFQSTESGEIFNAHPGEEIGRTGCTLVEANYSRIVVRDGEGRVFRAEGLANFAWELLSGE